MPSSLPNQTQFFLSSAAAQIILTLLSVLLDISIYIHSAPIGPPQIHEHPLGRHSVAHLRVQLRVTDSGLWQIFGVMSPWPLSVVLKSEDAQNEERGVLMDIHIWTWS